MCHLVLEFEVRALEPSEGPCCQAKGEQGSPSNSAWDGWNPGPLVSRRAGGLKEFIPVIKSQQTRSQPSVEASRKPEQGGTRVSKAQKPTGKGRMR